VAKFQQVFGAQGSNSVVAAAGAASNGSAVSNVARTRNDTYASTMLANFSGDGIDVEHVGVDDDVNSETALVIINHDGDNCLSVAPGSNNCLSPSHVDAADERIKPLPWC
jgi:ribokinase